MKVKDLSKDQRFHTDISFITKVLMVLETPSDLIATILKFIQILNFCEKIKNGKQELKMEILASKIGELYSNFQL